ncbi:MAG: hypothetical protein GXY76_04675 [Chloroflexi bacterium]|nr:hypothetical protein [Chloroflexota bacterium]
MLYLIGGAARAGKTILAHRLFREHQVPYLCVDYFVSALEQGAPELGIVGESPTRPKAEALWPRLVGLLRNVVEVEPAYTVEGDALWPQGVAAFMAEYPGLVRACFIGYTETTPPRKLAEIRRHAGNVNDWIQHHDDGYVLNLCAEMIDWSRFLRDECARLGLPYVDASVAFAHGLERAFQRLLGGSADSANVPSP